MSSLDSAPNLPAEIMTSHCYASMFRGCTQISSTPNLLSTQLAENCYEHMFASCSTLTHIQELPSTTLANECYVSMFESCEALKITDEPSITAHKIFEYTDSVANYPVEDMFANINGQSSFKDGTPVLGNTYYWYA